MSVEEPEDQFPGSRFGKTDSENSRTTLVAAEARIVLAAVPFVIAPAIRARGRPVALLRARRARMGRAPREEKMARLERLDCATPTPRGDQFDQFGAVVRL